MVAQRERRRLSLRLCACVDGRRRIIPRWDKEEMASLLADQMLCSPFIQPPSHTDYTAPPPQLLSFVFYLACSLKGAFRIKGR